MDWDEVITDLLAPIRRSQGVFYCKECGESHTEGLSHVCPCAYCNKVSNGSVMCERCGEIADNAWKSRPL